MNSRSTQRLLWGVLTVALVLIGGFALFNWMRQASAPPLEDYGAIPAYRLTNQHGQAATDADLKGHISVADLVFTHCTSICPMLTGKMYELQTALKDQPDVKLVSYSVDPKNDAPDTLARYAELHHADPTRWTFLTGSVPTIYTLIKAGFHLPLDSVGGDQQDYPIIHSPRFILIDPRGHVRGYYVGSEDSARTAILHDISLLREETRQ